MRNLHSLIIAVFAIILTSFFSALSASSAESAPETGKQAPGFELTDLSGKPTSLAGLRGRVVLLNFWSVRCAPCVAEMPFLNSLHTTLNRDGFTVLAVSVDRSEQLVRSFMKEKRLDVPVLLDTGQEIAFDAYAVTDLPISYLIDKGGTIVEILRGPKDWDSGGMKKKIQRLLDRK